MLKFGLLGRGAGAPPPLVIDDYIFYEMKNFPALPERFVEDTGVSGEVTKRSQPRSTQYDGRLHSSDFLALSPTVTVDVPLVHTDTDGVITLPANSYFTRFDFATQQWVTMSATGDAGEMTYNGEFTVDLSGWLNWGLATSVWDNGTAIITPDSGNGIYQEIKTIPNVEHTITVDGFNLGSNGRLRLGRTAGSTEYLNNSTINGVDVEFTFIPISTVTYITLGSGGAGDVRWDNIRAVAKLPISSTFHLNSPCKDAFPHDAPLTDEDLVALNDDPNLIYDVVYNGYILPSGFSVANMVGGDTSVGLTPMFYPMTEGVAGGAFVQNVLVPLGVVNADVTVQQSAISGVGNTFVLNGINEATVHQDVDTLDLSYPYFHQVVGNLSPYHITYKINVLLGSIVFRGVVNESGNILGGGIKPVGEHAVSSVMKGTPTSGGRLESNFLGTDASNVYPNDYIINWEVRSVDALPINGYLESARTSLINQRVGSVETRTEKDASGRLIGTQLNQWLQFTGKGDYVDTGIIIDGTLTDFSMMMVFTLDDEIPEFFRYIADSGDGANRIHLLQSGGLLRSVQGNVGQFTISPQPLPEADFYAMIVNWNLANQTLEFAINGSPMSAPAPAVFDGATSATIKLGIRTDQATTSMWDEKIGLGFLKAGLTSEAEWQDYWAEVQSIYTPNVKVLRINELQSGYCDLGITNPCVATSQHQVIVGDDTGALTYTWSSVGGTIASGQGTDTVEVTTDVGNNRGLNNEDVTGHTYDTGSGADNTIEIDPIVIGKFDIHQESQGSDPYYPRVDLINDNHVIGQGYEAIVSVEVTGTCILQRFEIGTESGVNQFDVVDELMTDEIRQWHFPAAYFRSGGRWSISFNGQDEFNFDAVAYLSFRKILEGGDVEPDITFALTCNVDDTLTQDSLAVQVTHNRSPS